MRDDEDDFIDDMIAYHIIMDEDKGGGGGKTPKGSGSCLSWILLVEVIMFVIGLIGQCTGCGN